MSGLFNFFSPWDNDFFIKLFRSDRELSSLLLIRPDDLGLLSGLGSSVILPIDRDFFNTLSSGSEKLIVDLFSKVFEVSCVCMVSPERSVLGLVSPSFTPYCSLYIRKHSDSNAFDHKIFRFSFGKCSLASLTIVRASENFTLHFFVTIFSIMDGMVAMLYLSLSCPLSASLIASQR